MAQIAEVLAGKNKLVFTMDRQASVFEALEMMVANNLGSILVTNDGSLCGIFTERDYARKLVLLGRFSKDTKVREVMTTDVPTVAPEASLEEAMRLMTERRTRHLPVVEGERVVGVVSIGDLVKAIITHQGMLIAELSRYVSENR